jgi:ATP/maltotriose-dependent transcriptional regulator MalT
LEKIYNDRFYLLVVNMRRLAHLVDPRVRLTLTTKTSGRVLENSVKLKPIVHRGQSILPYAAWETIAKSLRISNRELQIVQGVFDDRKEYAIAHELKISMHTVHTHLERLYRKLGVTSRLGLVLCIVSEYLSLLPPTL